MVPWPISGILKYRLPDEHQPLRGRGCQIAFVFVLDRVHPEYPRTKLSSARYPTSLQSCGLVPKWSCVLPHTQVPYTGCIRARMQKSEDEQQPFGTLVDECVPIATSLVGALPCQSGSGLHRGSRRLVWGRKRRASHRQAIATRCPCLSSISPSASSGRSLCLAGLTLVRPRIYPSVRYNKVEVFVCERVGVASTSNVGMQSTALGYQIQIESCLETEEVIS